MPSQAIQENIQIFVGYFEEPEPGVPDGCTGWYHSGGKFPVRTAGEVFTTCEHNHTQLREDIAGPFTCRDDAIADLRDCLPS